MMAVLRKIQRKRLLRLVYRVVIQSHQDERLAKFFTMLGTILEERKQLFKGGNYSQYVRVNGVVIPSIIIVIDNYSNFKNKTNNIYEDMILQLSKDGVSYGIFLVVTAGGFGALEIPGRIGDNLRTVVCLEMSDKFQYADALRTMHIDTLPEVNIKGRGLAKVGEQLLEFQTGINLFIRHTGPDVVLLSGIALFKIKQQFRKEGKHLLIRIDHGQRFLFRYIGQIAAKINNRNIGIPHNAMPERRTTSGPVCRMKRFMRICALLRQNSFS